jgi:hypothetical protein
VVSTLVAPALSVGHVPNADATLRHGLTEVAAIATCASVGAPKIDAVLRLLVANICNVGVPSLFTAIQYVTPPVKLKSATLSDTVVAVAELKLAVVASGAPSGSPFADPYIAS